MNSRNIPVEWLPQYTYADYESWEGDWELIYGIPYAMSPSAKRVHQSAGRKFVVLVQEALNKKADHCDCEVFYELDWIVDDTTVVRPDIMIVCGKFKDDFLRFPPSLIIEITSKRTQMTDRNIKFKLYESNGVSYYLIVDTDRKTTDIFQLVNQRYQAVESNLFTLTETCQLDMDVKRPLTTNDV